MGSEQQCSLTQQWDIVVLVGQGNCFFPVNEEEEEEKKEKVEEDENMQQEEDEIRTTM